MSTLSSLSTASPRKALPVTAHPLFPAIVAVWFAALLGLSSLALAPAMLERIVGATGIASFVSAAAPPLGQTARLLIALGLAGLGACVGLTLAHFLGARALRAKPELADVLYAGSDEAYEAQEELSDEPREPRMGVRERLARLTGQGDGPRDFDDLPKLRARDRHPDAPGRKPLSPADDIAADDLAADAETPAEPLATAQLPEVAEGDEPLELDMVLAEEVPAALDASVAVPAILAAPLESLGVVQLTERLAIAMRARRARDARRAAADAADLLPVVLPSLVALRPAEQTSEPEHVTPVANAAAPAPDTAAIDPEKLKNGYSSLLDLTRKPSPREAARSGVAAQPEPVAAFSGRVGSFSDTMPGRVAANERIDEIFANDPIPTSLPRAGDAGETYRSLKAALASLQRISGTR